MLSQQSLINNYKYAYIIPQVTGETALFFAAAKGKVDLVQKMLDQGADPNARNHVSIIILLYPGFYFPL